ncbi:hypothetical protein GTZ99_03335 [Novosphingobium sp. FSY-8]|uniref:Uncharacterized protein n=1 Tax=Novosphingobium ovatum TaxID=1908523 RepID=A0ABW9XAL8_9SPHN|nr:hypothetical protein [Novosphingobium ovatum]NBC35586.1 hypothetical protein [Novosphingobium ovatum]
MMLWMLAAVAGMSDPQFDAARSRAPADVVAFIDRWEGCNHWGGEPVPDKDVDPQQQRAKQIERMWKKGRCDYVRADFKVLRAKYRANPRIARLLAEVRSRYD